MVCSNWGAFGGPWNLYSKDVFQKLLLDWKDTSQDLRFSLFVFLNQMLFDGNTCLLSVCRNSKPVILTQLAWFLSLFQLAPLVSQADK